jgi:glycosyltransferase involved in cell wall biosynthesis
MLDLSVIILTYNEELHIRRCIENVLPIVKEIFLVDSYSTDKTIEIAESLGAKIYQNKWENNYSKQFNWGLTHLPIQTKWVLRLDADEYLTDELKQEIREKLPILEDNISGVVIKLRYVFLNKWIKRGIYPLKLLRLFKYGKGWCQEKWMDEHIRISDGEIIELKYDMVDHNLNNLGWWIQKHNGYSIREAFDLLDIELGLSNTVKDAPLNLSEQALKTRNKKLKYVKMPLFLRAFLFFAYRYIYKMGFIEGQEAFLRHFFQGWWYRTLVDAKIYEIKQACGNDKEKIIEYIKINYGIDCRNI